MIKCKYRKQCNLYNSSNYTCNNEPYRCGKYRLYVKSENLNKELNKPYLKQFFIGCGCIYIIIFLILYITILMFIKGLFLILSVLLYSIYLISIIFLFDFIEKED